MKQEFILSLSELEANPENTTRLGLFLIQRGENLIQEDWSGIHIKPMSIYNLLLEKYTKKKMGVK